MNLKLRVFDRERRIGRETYRAPDGFEPLTEERVVVVDAAPALTVEGVGDIELRAPAATLAPVLMSLTLCGAVA